MRRAIALFVALMLVGGGAAAAVPVTADAAPAKAAKAKKKTKKAKRKKRKGKRRAAAAKPVAAAGPQGPAGPPGPPGTAIVARARSGAPQTVAGMTNAPIALQGAGWTQQADETDDFVGEATVTLPSECTASGPGPADNPVWWLEDQVAGWEYVGGAWIDLKLGREYVGYADFPVFEGDAGKTVTRSFHIDRKLMEPGTPTARELTAEIGTYCENDGASFTVQALKVNVIGIR